MIDVKQGIRTAFFTALSGNLTFNSQTVGVSDEMKAPSDPSPIWVILSTQMGTERNTFSGWASDETIDLDIVYKTSTATGKLPLDQLAGQILALICPTVVNSGLPPQPGMQMLNVKLQSDRTLSLSLNQSNSVMRRILTFKLYVAQL